MVGPPQTKMNFNSIQYGVFLLAVLVAAWGLAGPSYHRVRLWFLLAASYFFYACWEPGYLVLILLVTGVNFGAGLKIAAASEKSEFRGQQFWLWIAVAGSLSLLAFFKYYNFFAGNLNAVFSGLRLGTALPGSALLLPVGISFYTFQSLSYTIDVYRGRQTATRSLRDFALFISFFPHLVAGPIVRSHVLLDQFQGDPVYADEEVARGLYQVLCGLAKKALLADGLAHLLVDPAFARAGRLGSPLAWLAMYGYAFQIYLDFSGYSDVAIGSARMLGIRIPENFRRPYLAQNLRDFWRRWHISLSSWLRDYLYLSLGGSKKGRGRMYLAIFLTMLLGGLWHGAAWTFIAWGAYHGALLMVNRLLQERNENSGDPVPASAPVLWLKRLATFHLVGFGWVIFRSPGLSAALSYFSDLVTGPLSSSGLPPKALPLLLLALLLHLAPEKFRDRLGDHFSRLPLPFQALALALLLALINLMKSVSAPFIYFQF